MPITGLGHGLHTIKETGFLISIDAQFLWENLCIISFFNQNYSIFLPNYIVNASFLLKHIYCGKQKSCYILSPE
jgi:hypothetical protein